MRGDLDSGTAPSQQSHTSEIRTVDRYPDDDELGPMTQHGYIVDSLLDEVSSEDSFFSSAVQEHSYWTKKDSGMVEFGGMVAWWHGNLDFCMPVALSMMVILLMLLWLLQLRRPRMQRKARPTRKGVKQKIQKWVDSMTMNYVVWDDEDILI
jgi:hypothetical protein